MASGPTRPALRARYERRQRAVVDESAAVFARRGYAQTSVQDLAAELGVAAGGLYHYFGGKEELLIRICDELLEPLLAQAHALLEREAEPEERLRALVRLWVAHVIAHRDHMLVFQQQRHAIESGEQWRGVRASRKRFERIVEGALAAAGAPERSGVEPRLALAALLGMVNHTAQWYRPRGPLTPEQVADGYVALVLGAV